MDGGRRERKRLEGDGGLRGERREKGEGRGWSREMGWGGMEKRSRREKGQWARECEGIRKREKLERMKREGRAKGGGRETRECEGREGRERSVIGESEKREQKEEKKGISKREEERRVE